MIEIPESRTIGLQASAALAGRKIIKVRNATSPHKFTFYCGDPLSYAGMLERKKIENVLGYGAFIELFLEEDTRLVIGDGTHMRYYYSPEEIPDKYQLLMELDNSAVLIFTVTMYGAIYALHGDLDNPYYKGSKEKHSPLDQKFTPDYFDRLLKKEKKDLSAKAFLATGQRIPGLGNGVLQDILFNARIHPKSKMFALGSGKLRDLYYSVKETLGAMTARGGRDTEKDFYGNPGGYRTLLSKNTVSTSCPRCGGILCKETYLGGAVYFCPACQKL